MTTPPPADLPERASVVVVGGGLTGVCAAFHLAEAGVRDVVLVERHALGSGAAAKAGGGVRFSAEAHLRLAALGLASFARFRARPGVRLDPRRGGHLFVVSEREGVAAFERGVAVRAALGVPTTPLDPDDAVALCPLLDPDRVLAAAHSPDDDHRAPRAVVVAYAEAARRLGARLLTGVTALDVGVRGGEVRSVTTDRGVVATGAVVCAAGVWSRAVGDLAGVDLPVTPLHRQVVLTGPVPALPTALPFTVDLATTAYLHREGRGVLVGVADPDLPDRPVRAAARLAPALLDVPPAGGRTGLHEVTPDRDALLGEARGVGRFLYATGFSGHGLLRGPAVGEVLRDLYLGREPAVDASSWDAARFARAPRPAPDTASG
ncbi:NAD(P)/FAD-dependent oxidoreductase [Saccharothrix sp. Mg75]|uniref:NAD(P)/FAD-dependent oxidoreductase n=1 Tax=Saccharothrix sp. Mg75 TaxID=3445357 RepID=UPI003EE8D4CA